MRSKEQLDALEARMRQLEEKVARLEEAAAGKPAAEEKPARKTARK